MKRFALIGSAGYIAPRHMKAIKETGNDLICTLDPYDGMGIIDSYFPNADFFTETERFDKHLDRLRRSGNGIDYVSICSPNYLHDSHIRMALRYGSHAICEKPLVINPKNLYELEEIENETGKKIYTILQLRLHPIIQALKYEVENGPMDKIYDIDLTYITSRGKWYFYSGKGDVQKSGGLATNIGVHFFDMLTWIFGDHSDIKIISESQGSIKGELFLKRAKAKWFLSISETDLPKNIFLSGKRTYRKIEIDGKELEFSDGFTDLHTVSYENILSGNGFSIKDSRESIEIVSKIRNYKTK